MEKEEEQHLVRRARSGDREALRLLWDAITPKLYGYLVNTVHDKGIADDLLQQTWLAVITHLHQYTPGRARFSAWLFAIARNECRQHWRKRTDVPLDVLEQDDVPRMASPDHATIDLERILQTLSEDDRELLRLRYIADLSFADLARILSISTIAARVRVHRALARARNNL